LFIQKNKEQRETAQPPTKCLCNGGVWCKFVALVFKQRFVTVDSDV